MKKEVAKVCLVYENMTDVDIPLKYIGFFHLGDIKQEISRWCNETPKLYTRTEEFFIAIDRSFEQEKREGIRDYKAISSVIIDFDTGEEMQYFPPWGEEHFINTYETTCFNKHGDLFVAITRDPESVTRFMDDERINKDNFKLNTVFVYEPKEKKERQPSVNKPFDPDMTIEELDFSVRTYNCLKRALINTLGDLSKQTMESLSKVRNLGRKSTEEVIDKCKEHGIELRDDDE